MSLIFRWFVICSFLVGDSSTIVDSVSSSLFDFDGEVNLHPQHVPFFFRSNPEVKDLCAANSSCPYHILTHKIGCWGYEENCNTSSIYSVPKCPGDHCKWVKSKKEQIDMFFSQGDFGYIKDRKKEMKFICKPQHPDDSSLECVDHLRFCKSRNIFINFENLLTIEQPMRYRMDVLKNGQIGGRCHLNIPLLEERLTQKSPLQSWAPELQNFVKSASRPIADKKCDLIIDKPTFLMKLDATVSLYHHFCDFLNLYLTQHMNNSFSRDVFILIWDTLPYRSNFGITWKAFTKHPVMDLQQFAGKKVCFRDLIFSFLPRMIYGMYYNMPLIDGCSRSGLFHAFSHHVLHRLGVQRDVENNRNKLRVTFLSRETSFRNILNEDELVRALEATSDYEVKKVNFNHNVPFLEQLQITHNTDIFIGIHGAGLTHLLFLPDWAVVFEIYNCEDDACYRDLANLRGVQYMTWEKMEKLTQQDQGHHPTMGAHAKFTNYSFDVAEFLRLVNRAKRMIRSDYRWQRFAESAKHDEL